MHVRTAAQRANARLAGAAGSQPGTRADTCDGAFNLGDALRESFVRESTFDEFRAALMRCRQRAH